MTDVFRTSRRGFLKIGTSAAGGMLIAAVVPGCLRERTHAAGELEVLIRIEPDNRVIFRAPCPETGQHLTTSQAMLVAEELDVDFDSLIVERLPLMLRRRDDGTVGYAGVPQFSGGSQALRRTWRMLLRAGANARARLIRAAAEDMGVDHGSCRTETGRVVHAATGTARQYGEVAYRAARLQLDENEVTLKPRGEYRILGTPMRSLENEDVVTGRAEFGIDVELPGMLHAVIERAPAFGAELESYDDSATLAVAGVRGTVEIRGAAYPHYIETVRADGVAVVADTLWAAMEGRRRLTLKWSDAPYPDESDASHAAEAERKLASANPLPIPQPLDDSVDYAEVLERGSIARQYGDVDEAFLSADRSLRRSYELPFLAHATMEPMNCTAHVHEGGCDIHVASQLPQAMANTVADYLDIDVLRVNVFPKRIGGGFGRRLRSDFALEAVIVSRAVDAPVKVTWTREDDLRYDYYRPKARFDMSAAVDRQGVLTAWHVREASTPLETHPQEIAVGKAWQDVELRSYYSDNGMFAAEELYYDNFPAHPSFVPNCRMEHVYVHSAAGVHAWRAPGVMALEFANQSFLDELAHELGEDPLQFRLDLIGSPTRYPFRLNWIPDHENGRLAAVLALAAEKADWGRYRNTQGYGQGIASAYNWGTYVAHVVDVSVESGGALTVAKVTSAVDCGPVINPEGVRKQVEGGINDALSAALWQEINVRDAFPVQSNFHDYRMMRIDESPRAIEVHLIEGGGEDDLRGMGEPPVPPLAPALCNAIFAASGKRIRRLPIADQLGA